MINWIIGSVILLIAPCIAGIRLGKKLNYLPDFSHWAGVVAIGAFFFAVLFLSEQLPAFIILSCSVKALSVGL